MAVVALNTRLGCLSAQLTAESEAQQMIDAVHVTNENMWKLESGVPIYRFITTAPLRKIFQAQDFFTKYAIN